MNGGSVAGLASPATAATNDAPPAADLLVRRCPR